MRTRKISANAAVGLGIAAGFAFLIGLGAGLRVLPGNAALLIGFGVMRFASLGLLMGKNNTSSVYYHHLNLSAWVFNPRCDMG